MKHASRRLIFLALLWPSQTASFRPTLKPRPNTRLANAMQQRPGESRSEFFQRVTQAASDPETFRKLALNQPEEKKAPVVEDDDKPKKGYQRAEDWEAEQKNKKTSDMTWEERVQFEGQRQGNKLRQNEILKHHIGTFF